MRPNSCSFLVSIVFLLVSVSFGQVEGDYATEVTELNTLLDTWKTREDVPVEVRDMVAQQGQMLIDMINGKAPCLGIDDALIGTFANVLASFANKLSYPCTGVSADAYHLGQQMLSVARSIARTAEASTLTKLVQDQPMVDSRLLEEASADGQGCFVILRVESGDNFPFSAVTDITPLLFPTRRPVFNKFTDFRALAVAWPAGGNFFSQVYLANSSSDPPPQLTFIDQHPFFIPAETGAELTGQWIEEIGLRSPVKDGHYEIQIDVTYQHPDVPNPCHGSVTLVLQDPPDR